MAIIKLVEIGIRWQNIYRCLCLKHVFLSRVNCPVVTLARSTQSLGQLEETLVEREIVTNRVLPALIGATEERELLLKTTRMSSYFADINIHLNLTCRYWYISESVSFLLGTDCMAITIRAM